MSQTFYIKQGDTSPSIAGTLKDASSAAVNLTGATVRFHLRKPGVSPSKVDAAASVTDAPNGGVAYAWQTGDTNEAGAFHGEWEVTFGGGAIETFPNHGFVSVHVEPQLA